MKMVIEAVFWEEDVMARFELREVKRVRLLHFFCCDITVCLWIVGAWNFEGTY